MAEYIADINRKVQNDRLSELNKSLNEVIAANARAVELLVEIISSNPRRMLMGKENIIIRGDLATYCIPIEPILNRLKSPFSNSETGFDTVEVHPKDHFVRQEARACIQVDAEEHIPSGDVIASYLLGLSNDMVTWTKPNMRPLRDALLQTYGLTTSPLTKPLVQYLKQQHNAIMDVESGYLTLPGTNGFTWRIGFANPLVYGFTIEMKKPRQMNWQLISEDTRTLPSSYRFDNILDSVELITEFPHSLVENKWDAFPLMRRIVAQQYKPLAKQIYEENSDEDNNTYVSMEHNETLLEMCVKLDQQIAKLASA